MLSQKFPHFQKRVQQRAQNHNDDAGLGERCRSTERALPWPQRRAASAMRDVHRPSWSSAKRVGQVGRPTGTHKSPRAYGSPLPREVERNRAFAPENCPIRFEHDGWHGITKVSEIFERMKIFQKF